MKKKLLIIIEIIGGLIWITTTIIFGLDYFFNTNIVETIANKNAIAGAILDEWKAEIQYQAINDSDPFYINLKENFEQIIEAESIKTIKVQTISDSQKKFIITDKTNKTIFVLITKTWNNFTIQKSIEQ